MKYLLINLLNSYFMSVMKGLELIDEPYRSIIEKFFNIILEHFGEKLVSFIIYGSVARGDYRRNSDIDIFIVVEDALPSGRLPRTNLMEKLVSKLDPYLDKLIDQGYEVSVSPIIKTTDEAKLLRPLYLDMIDDAIILYDKNHFFSKVLEKLRNRLNELGAEKVYVGKKWYWRLKKEYKFGDEIII